MATRLRRDHITAQALAAVDRDTVWVDLPQPGSRAADITLEDGTRTVVVESDARAGRNTQRTAQIIDAAETQLLALEYRVRAGRVKDPAKIGRAAQRILNTGRVARLFDLQIGPGRFLYHYNQQAHAYEKLLAGRYVLTTSLTPAQADTTQMVAALPAVAKGRDQVPGPQRLPTTTTGKTMDRKTSPRTRRQSVFTLPSWKRSSPALSPRLMSGVPTSSTSTSPPTGR